MLALVLRDGRSITRRQFIDIDINQHGNALIMSIPVEEAGLNGAEIVRLDLPSAEFRHLTAGLAPTLSPDGKYLAYRDNDGDLWIGELSARGLTPIRNLLANWVTARAFKISERTLYSWSPDSSKLAYIKITQSSEAGSQSSAIKFPIAAELRVFDVNTLKDRLIYQAENEMWSVSWAGAGDEIALVQGRYDHRRPQEPFSEVVLIDASSGRPNIISREVGFVPIYTMPIASPDGKKIAINYDPFKIRPANLTWEPAVIDVDSHVMRLFTDRPFLKRLFEPPIWSRESKNLSFVCKEGALFSSICTTSLSGQATKMLQLEPLEDIVRFRTSFDEQRIAWVSQDVLNTVRVRIAAYDGSSVRTVYEQSKIDWDRTAVGDVKTVRWSGRDGLMLSGLIVLPVNYRVGEKYPLVVDVHGGPYGGIRLAGSLLNASPLEWQVWAARGYTVLIPDYRASGVYGSDENHFRRKEGSALLDAYADDVLSGIDHVIELGFVDPERIAIIGHSYGAFITDWLITKTDRFASAISKEGSFNPARLTYREADKLWLFNTTRENYDSVVRRSSPLTYAASVKTPVLFISAEHGVGKQVYGEFSDIVNSSGGYAEHIHYLDEYHVIKKEENVRDLFLRSIEWIDQTVGGTSLSSPGANTFGRGGR